LAAVAGESVTLLSRYDLIYQSFDTLRAMSALRAESAFTKISTHLSSDLLHVLSNLSGVEWTLDSGAFRIRVSLQGIDRAWTL
jgi:hypothetical protein